MNDETAPLLTSGLEFIDGKDKTLGPACPERKGRDKLQTVFLSFEGEVISLGLLGFDLVRNGRLDLPGHELADRPLALIDLSCFFSPVPG